MAALELLLSWSVTTALLFAVVLVDERRLDDERLARAWPPASRDAALVAFGVLALPIHFARTRGDLRSARGAVGVVLGLLLGCVVTALVVVASGVVLEGLALVLGLPG